MRFRLVVPVLLLAACGSTPAGDPALAKALRRVSGVEQQLGIADPGVFTP